jgi:hypothetical protein
VYIDGNTRPQAKNSRAIGPQELQLYERRALASRVQRLRKSKALKIS